ncbi:DUF2842 domain-containing protein [Sphingomonas oligophenolica]|uniref:DUF2842 domain-containing protein n=1 Tax=Sphingomonas oligophenolica TaxID=301154 RepID=A0A502CIH6_9SPHN|nr:DUF2842 domain-containing protein [Sphingomonas oligophenolica]TPG12414.1 DUF2842 domain-containing protein [Sphingomonas oligophenolica]
MDRIVTPSWRKPAGMLIILTLLLLWCVAIVSLSGLVGRWHWALQLAFYIAAGIAWLWLLPMRRMLSWMETGRFR